MKKLLKELKSVRSIITICINKNVKGDWNMDGQVCGVCGRKIFGTLDNVQERQVVKVVNGKEVVLCDMCRSKVPDEKQQNKHPCGCGYC